MLLLSILLLRPVPILVPTCKSAQEEKRDLFVTEEIDQAVPKMRGSEMLEPCAVKAACTVLRGGKFVKTNLSQHVQNTLYQGFESLRLQMTIPSIKRSILVRPV